MGAPAIARQPASAVGSTVAVAQHVAGGGNGYARYLFPAVGVLATLVVIGLDRIIPRVLPAAVVVLLVWWAIANIPTAVDPHRVHRPRDRGARAPLALQVLPGDDALRLLIAVVIGVSTVLAVTAVVVGAGRRRHPPRGGAGVSVRRMAASPSPR